MSLFWNGYQKDSEAH